MLAFFYVSRAIWLCLDVNFASSVSLLSYSVTDTTTWTFCYFASATSLCLILTCFLWAALSLASSPSCCSFCEANFCLTAALTAFLLASSASSINLSFWASNLASSPANNYLARLSSKLSRFPVRLVFRTDIRDSASVNCCSIYNWTSASASLAIVNSASLFWIYSENPYECSALIRVISASCSAFLMAILSSMAAETVDKFSNLFFDFFYFLVFGYRGLYWWLPPISTRSSL